MACLKFDAGGIAEFNVIDTSLKLKPWLVWMCTGRAYEFHVFALAHRSYDMAIKLKAIAAAEGWSKQATAYHFKIDAELVREWCSQKEKLKTLKKKGGRCGASDSKEQDGSLWTVTWKKAKTMVADKDPLSDFMASKGQLQLFLKRMRLNLRKETLSAGCSLFQSLWALHAH